MRMRTLIIPLALLGLGFTLVSASEEKRASGDPENERIVRGYQIAPVPLTLRNRDRKLVGLGSYIVNAQGGCNDCHTWPNYAPGGDPFLGQPEQINTARYLAGGRPFGPVVSANITPFKNGMPAGLTLSEFIEAIRTGHDPDVDPARVERRARADRAADGVLPRAERSRQDDGAGVLSARAARLLGVLSSTGPDAPDLRLGHQVHAWRSVANHFATINRRH